MPLISQIWHCLIVRSKLDTVSRLIQLIVTSFIAWLMQCGAMENLDEVLELFFQWSSLRKQLSPALLTIISNAHGHTVPACTCCCMFERCYDDHFASMWKGLPGVQWHHLLRACRSRLAYPSPFTDCLKYNAVLLTEKMQLGQT